MTDLYYANQRIPVKSTDEIGQEQAEHISRALNAGFVLHHPYYFSDTNTIHTEERRTIHAYLGIPQPGEGLEADGVLFKGRMADLVCRRVIGVDLIDNAFVEKPEGWMYEIVLREQ